MAKAKFSYQESIAELQAILEALEGGEVSIDELALKVKRGKELLKQCQDKLRATEKVIEELVE